MTQKIAIKNIMSIKETFSIFKYEQIDEVLEYIDKHNIFIKLSKSLSKEFKKGDWVCMKKKNIFLIQKGIKKEAEVIIYALNNAALLNVKQSDFIFVIDKINSLNLNYEVQKKLDKTIKYLKLVKYMKKR